MTIESLRAKPQLQSRRLLLVGGLGTTQIIAWGTTFYLPAVFANSIARETGWSLSLVVAGLSLGLLLAGSFSPLVGRLIDYRGGRYVMAASSVVIACGLWLMSLSTSLAIFFMSWAVLGVGMAAGLYDAAFATLGRYYGSDARGAITGVTLLGGFASTLCWPLLTVLDETLGWRQGAQAVALVHLLLCLPLHLWIIPGASSSHHGSQITRGNFQGDRPQARTRFFRDIRFLKICLAFTLLAFVMTGLSVHLLEVLRQRGMETATVVMIGMLIGPAQVTARVLEFTFGRDFHPVWSARAGALLALTGVVLFSISQPLTAFIAAAVYGAGNGILTIARGTLPLAIFGAEAYGERMGVLARPILLAQASAPILMATALSAMDGLYVLLGLAGLMVLSCALLILLPAESR
ncbi:MFS transporter [Marinobacter sp.]|uniref:MFS transporter n=1 Tax=Marinobacter sp. TaxID=50741 RepID=UPI00356379B0